MSKEELPLSEVLPQETREPGQLTETEREALRRELENLSQ
jgi:hypothetical protein